MRALAGVITLSLVAVTAAHAAVQDPAYRVSITGSYTQQWSVTTSASGCAPASGSRTISFHNAAPLVLKASQLARTKNFLFDLAATEQRTVTLGYPAGTQCNDDASGCRAVSYTIGGVGTGVGLLNGTDGRFTLFWTSIKPDPYSGQCGGLNHMWSPGETPGSTGKTTIVNFPPGDIWNVPAYPNSQDRPYWKAATKADLYTGRPRMISFSDQGSDAFAAYSISWTVVLTPRP